MSRLVRSAAPSAITPATFAVLPGDGGGRPPQLLAPARRRALVDLLVSATRRALVVSLLAGLALLWSMPARAQLVGPSLDTTAGWWQNSEGGTVELRPFAGAFLPTGPARSLLKDGLLAGGQVSVRILPQLAATGTFAWTPNNDRTIAGAPTVDVYQYDVGLEARGAGWFQQGGWDFTPFVGAGVGGRTYSYRYLGVGSTTDFDGYGAVGGELGYGRVGLRVEARDYLSQYHPIDGVGPTTNHNDVIVVAGLRLRL